ncbi:MAG: hypothetical protein IJX92_08190 [Clostridia bacterium]|nr:hypothetical protein [Clostridia bacterium]
MFREDNLSQSRTYVWVYDGAGNIEREDVYQTDFDDVLDSTYYGAKEYGYAENSDRLTSYNGMSMTYDEIGNPIRYRDNRLVWQNGTQLASYGNITFAYNSDGMRTSKTVDGVTYNYILDGSRVMRQTFGNYVADYIYHEDGTPMAFAYYTVGGTVNYYYYETNLQGDVIAVYSESGELVMETDYDAWG